MTKTKKQLRAEAVERLVKLGEVGFYYEIIDALCDADCEDWSGDKVASTIRDLLTDDDSTISEDDSTAERGMTNIEWLYEHDGYVNSFAKLMACLRGFSTDAFTANEWLRQEHSNDDSTPEKVVSGSEPCVTPESCRQYADQRKQVDDADCESCDSREKLEAEASELVAEYAASGDVCDALYHGMLGLLDRQAAITAEETSNAWEEYRDATQLEIAKYEHDCGLLFDEKHKLTADAQKWADAANAQRLVAIEQADKVQELTAERDYYCDKFGKCLDYADAIHALIDDEGLA